LEGWDAGCFWLARDVIAFDGRTVDELQTSFQSVIDEYLHDCAQLGKDPAKPFSGRFNLRIDPTLHQQLVLNAERQGLSLNALVEQTLRAPRKTAKKAEKSAESVQRKTQGVINLVFF
jgi:predicted HicB family RNase H-like nuclease